MAAAVSKIMRLQDLVAVARKCRVVTRFRNTLGLPGTLGIRLQPYMTIIVMLGVGMAGLAGALFAPITNVHPAMGAEIVNRWLTEAEIGALLPTFHAVVLSHIEASQSGVAAAAFGAGLPVIATPVGGIIEQVEDQVTGVIAARADATALTEAAKRLLLDVSLYQRICGNLVTLREARSVRNFVEQCVSHGLYTHTSADEHPRRALDAQRASSMIR
jgi:hypothetical protein